MKSILTRFFPCEALLNISIMGLDAAGKTTLLYKLACSKVVETIPTIGFSIETAIIQASPSTSTGKKLRFTARTADAGGCSKIYPLVRHVMMDEMVSAMIWVVDANDVDRLGDSMEELSVLLHGTGGKEENFAVSMPIVVLANKIDLFSNGKTTETIRIVFEELLKGRRFAFFETSFQIDCHSTSSGLAEAFSWLGEAISAEDETTKNAKPHTLETAQDLLADMRSPAALSAKLETWLARAEADLATGEELLQQFYAHDLPSWDHYTHLRLAYILLLKHGRRVGKDKILTGFKDYIEHSGKVTGGKSFHLTMTYFWIQMVHLGITRMATFRERQSHTLMAGGLDPNATADTLVTANADNDRGKATGDEFAYFLTRNPYLVDAQLWAEYYSKEVLMSPEAKTGMRFPDRKKLPDVLQGRESVEV